MGSSHAISDSPADLQTRWSVENPAGFATLRGGCPSGRPEETTQCAL